MIFDYADPLVTTVAFLIIFIAGMTAIIHGKVKRQQTKTKRVTEQDYAITIPEAIKENQFQTDKTDNSSSEQTENSQIIIRKPHSVIAIWTEALTKWTAVLACAGIFGAIFALWTLRAIRGQLTEMQEERRPWIQGFVQFVGPLVFDKEGARVPIKLSLRNSGRSPAKHVWRGISMYPGDGPVALIMGWEDALCKSIVHDAAKGFTMFPDGSPSENISPVGIGASDITKNIDSDGGIILRIIVCIDYTFAFSCERHQTSYIWELDKKMPILDLLTSDPEMGPSRPMICSGKLIHRCPVALRSIEKNRI